MSHNISLFVSGSTMFVSGNIPAGANMVINVPLTVLSITSSLVVVSSSVIFQSGSTKWGDTPGDVHQFTGSIQVLGGISGSLSGTFFGTAQGSIIGTEGLTGSLQQVAPGVPYLIASSSAISLVTQSNGQVRIGLVAPTVVGQIMFALTTSSFVPALPITSDNGWLVNDAGILLVSSSG